MRLATAPNRTVIRPTRTRACERPAVTNEEEFINTRFFLPQTFCQTLQCIQQSCQPSLWIHVFLRRSVDPSRKSSTNGIQAQRAGGQRIPQVCKCGACGGKQVPSELLTIVIHPASTSNLWKNPVVLCEIKTKEPSQNWLDDWYSSCLGSGDRKIGRRKKEYFHLELGTELSSNCFRDFGIRHS
jgi:hypothetical protein